MPHSIYPCLSQSLHLVLCNRLDFANAANPCSSVIRLQGSLLSIGHISARNSEIWPSSELGSFSTGQLQNVIDGIKTSLLAIFDLYIVDIYPFGRSMAAMHGPTYSPSHQLTSLGCPYYFLVGPMCYAFTPGRF